MLLLIFYLLNVNNLFVGSTLVLQTVSQFC